MQRWPNGRLLKTKSYFIVINAVDERKLTNNNICGVITPPNRLNIDVNPKATFLKCLTICAVSQIVGQQRVASVKYLKL